MSAKDENMTMGLDRVNALFAWWGVPAATANGGLDRQMKCCQVFASDLQKAYGDAYSRQMQALFATNERITGSLQEFLRCRQPQDVLATESQILATVLEGTSSQAQIWVELTQKVQECCAAMAREAAEELRQPATGDAGARPPAKPAKEAGRQPAHA